MTDVLRLQASRKPYRRGGMAIAAHPEWTLVQTSALTLAATAAIIGDQLLKVEVQDGDLWVAMPDDYRKDVLANLEHFQGQQTRSAAMAAAEAAQAEADAKAAAAAAQAEADAKAAADAAQAEADAKAAADAAQAEADAKAAADAAQAEADAKAAEAKAAAKPKTPSKKAGKSD